MTDSHTEDKRGRLIHRGDTVHFVYGGAGHHMVVDVIDHHPESLLQYLHGTITVAVPAASTAVIDAAATPGKSSPTPASPKANQKEQ